MCIRDRFDGEDDNILIDHDSLLNLSNYERFSISLWVRPLKFINFGEEKSFIKKGSGDSSWNYKYSYVNDTSELVFNINEASEVSSNDVFLNIFDWYHFVIQKDGNYITQFINGDTISSVLDTTLFINNSSPLILGGSLDADDLFFGVIDDIIISGNYGFCGYKEPEDLSLIHISEPTRPY